MWPWIRDHRSGLRMWMCEPFGRSDPDSLINFGSDTIQETGFVFFFDQEPFHSRLHRKTFSQVAKRNGDIKQPMAYVVTSDYNSEIIRHQCSIYDWKPLYYFFHGWAALDWYRGYDKTFLIEPWQQRSPTKTFISPNRIVAGAREHRMLMLYWIFKLGLQHNYVSCPLECPAEKISIYNLAAVLPYSDASTVFRSVNLPMQFAGEVDHPMHSCWLSLFDQSKDSVLYLVTETVAQGRRIHLTEKTFKPIALGMPFVIVSTQGSLEYLRSYGFRTFDHVWDESYDQEPDDVLRIERVAQLIKSIDTKSLAEKQQLFRQCHSVIEHNWNHFYNGGFEKILWQELNTMLNDIEISN